MGPFGKLPKILFFPFKVDLLGNVISQRKWKNSPAKFVKIASGKFSEKLNFRQYFSKKFKIAGKLAFFMSTETSFFAHFFSKRSLLETKQDIDFKPKDLERLHNIDQFLTKIDIKMGKK